MQLLKTVAACCDWSENQHTTIGFIPTMGALHAGHLYLVEKSKEVCAKTIVSIYINPTQFAPHEDFSSYPKTLNSDLGQLENLGVDAVFLPTSDEIYPKNDRPFKYKNDLFGKLEGKTRPHFFYGVTQVVSKLFNVVSPSHTFFGEKDAQQLLIIKRMISDLNFKIKLVGCSTKRDKNGLALSSRNNYLSTQDQTKAGLLYKSLMLIKSAINKGENNAGILKDMFTASIKSNSDFKIDYISIANKETLEELKNIESNMLISAAVYFKDVRLIDNFSY